MNDPMNDMPYSSSLDLWSQRPSATRPDTTVTVGGRAAVAIVVLIAIAVIVVAASMLTVALSIHVEALSAAGTFGKGANAQMMKSLTAVIDVMKTNFLGVIGATMVLVILGLSAGHMWGDQRVHEKTGGLVKGVVGLVVASGFVA